LDSGVAGTGGFDAGGPDPSCAGVPIGFWRFDDCNQFRTDLSDSSFQGHTAFRNVDLQCTEGKERQAVSFAARGDLVYVPDQPDFGLESGVTVAAWVNPQKLDGVQTLFRKRDGLTSAFALVLNGDRYQFVIRLTSGRLATVSAPAQANTFSHVAATYDGTHLRLYVDGYEVDHTRASGTIIRGTGPLLMGNDILGRRFEGILDDAWFNTLAAPASTVLQLTCVRAPATIEVSPKVGPSVPAGTAVPYTLTVTNHNGPTCAAVGFQAFAGLPEGFTVPSNFTFIPPIPSGGTGSAKFDISSAEDAEAGSYTIRFQAFSTDNFSRDFLFTTAEYVVAEPTGCHVSSSRELTVREVSVVDDPVRTVMTGDAADPRTGAWSFGRLMERLSPAAADAPAVTEAMFRTFITPQTVNSFTIASRPAMEPQVLSPWPRTADGKLDLAKSPTRLLAIVNRLDLKDLPKGKAGEGRMVYGVLNPRGGQMEFTVILEYFLPAKDETEFRAWADSFHALQALPFPSESYNAALQAITDRFTGRNAIPDNPNGSSLIDIRTNEIALSFVWQLREFHLSPTTGFLDPAPVFLTPDARFNGSDRLGRFINDNEAAVVAETHEVPLSFENEPFLAASTFNNIDVWSAPNIKNPEARHKFSLNTCNGCHGGETNSAFLQIFPRNPGEQSRLSGFLTGTTVFDRFNRQQRRLNELSRRRKLLEAVLCPKP
jgi:hypothetical protein